MGIRGSDQVVEVALKDWFKRNVNGVLALTHRGASDRALQLLVQHNRTVHEACGLLITVCARVSNDKP